MKKKFQIKGFPTEISEEIELPNMGELLMMPMFVNVPAEFAIKRGGDFYKELIDKTPLRNDHKYVTISSNLQFLTPGIWPTPNYINHEKEEWHYDGSGNPFHDDQGRCHLYLNKCTSMTEFNTRELEIELEEGTTKKDVSYLLTDNAESIGLVGKKVPPNRIVTFDTHVHRVVMPTKPEIRFMYRVKETNHGGYEKQELAMKSGSVVFKAGLDSKEQAMRSIVRRKDEISIYYYR